MWKLSEAVNKNSRGEKYYKNFCMLFFTMPRPSISTATGDDGTTSLFGGGRISKASYRIQAYGDTDELNTIVGTILVEEMPENIRSQLTELQRMLFVLGADLATPLDSTAEVSRITEAAVQMIEQWGTELEKSLPSLSHFILPGGTRAACALHRARTVCRRTERWVVALVEKQQKINEHARIFLNRLSDYLFLAARVVNREAGVEEREWVPVE
jgi:cob(I)alamin adenosyltransferase